MNIRSFSRFAAAAVLAAAFLFSGVAMGANTVPTKISSDSMSYDMSGRNVSFSGNVYVERPDFTITSETLSVRFSPGKEPAAAAGEAPRLDPGRIERIIAQGNVVIKREGRIGRCSKATYLVSEGLLKLEGSPVLEDGKNRINGEIIKLYLKDNRSEIIGSKTRRVEAVFTTPENIDNN